jgi:putative protease
MLGIRSESDKRESAESEPFEKITRKLPLTFKASLKQGRPASLIAIAGGKEISVAGATPETARTAPISEETLKKCLSKLGDTPYFLERLEIELDDGLMLPISSLNALRRSAIEALGAKNTRSSEDFFKNTPREKLEKNREKINSAVFFQPQRMPKDAKDFFNYIYIPLEAYSERTCDGLGVMLPEVIFDSEREEIEKMLAEAYANGARDALVGNLGHIELAKRQGFTVHGDMRLGASNSQSVAALMREGVSDVILSPELTLPQIRDIGGRVGVCVYGRLPLMITEKCVGLEIGGCKLCESGEARLVDRRDTEFPVLKRFGHRSAIFNSVPIYMADRESELMSAGITQRHFIFTTEGENQIKAIIKAHKIFAQTTEPCRRIKK